MKKAEKAKAGNDRASTLSTVGARPRGRPAKNNNPGTRSSSEPSLLMYNFRHKVCHSPVRKSMADEDRDEVDNEEGEVERKENELETETSMSVVSSGIEKQIEETAKENRSVRNEEEEYEKVESVNTAVSEAVVISEETESKKQEQMPNEEEIGWLVVKTRREHEMTQAIQKAVTEAVKTTENKLAKIVAECVREVVLDMEKEVRSVKKRAKEHASGKFGWIQFKDDRENQ